MNAHILNKFGFQSIQLKEQNPVPGTTEMSVNISAIRPQDHRNPQVVVKLPREVLTQMKWEITDRVALMSNTTDKTLALVKTTKKNPNSFAISTQGSTVEQAKQSKRGGVVKVGWRADLCEEISALGTYPTKMEIFGDSVIVKLPDEFFA